MGKSKVGVYRYISKPIENMRVNGSRANNMEKVSIEILKESKEGASGLMAKEWPGST